MSSEKLASAQSVQKGNLGGAWDILSGAQGQYTDLGVARRFGGAAAAYSLRDIGAVNGRVVKVRRDVDGQGSDPEEDFSAQQVDSGALGDWVSGKHESTLPADVATAAAAYSLRKVKDGYSGNAVRIRRTSDSVEVNVAFDSDDKVSSSSAITNTTEQGGESGETNATTVAEFLSEERTTFITNPNFSTTTAGASVTSQTTTNSSSTFTFTASSGAFIRDASKGTNIGADLGDTVSFDVTASGLSQTFGIRVRQVGSNSNVHTQDGLDNGTQTISFTVSSNEPAGYFNFTDLLSSGTGTITIDNLKVVGKSATVHTWYDQTGSNNAVQETAANQPKIAESGALLADGLDFDGSNDNLTLGDICDNINNFSAFMFAKSDGATGGTQICWSQGASGDSNIFYQGRNDANVLFGYTATANTTTSTVSQFQNGFLFTSIAGSSTAKSFGNAVESVSVSSSSSNPSSNNTIGSHFSANYFDGSIQELVLFNSDQSDNRFKIESNINNYYGLYNDENAFSANAQVDGTGSTVSNASKDGGTLTLSSASGNNYLYFQLTETVPATSGDVFISFNYESSNESVALNNVKLRDDSDSAKSGDLVDSGGTTITIQKNGFYSGKLASANLTDTGTRLAFLTTQTTDGYTFTISNLRYSRIARNGFVETWYDQSGNFRPLIQTTATEQPSIVENGGFIGGVKADVATSSATMQNLQVSTDGTTPNFGTDDWANGGTKLGLMYVGSIPDTPSTTSPCVIWGGGRGVSSFQAGGVSLQVIKGGTDSWRLVNERQDLSPSAMSTAVSLNSDDNVILYGTADNRDFTIKINASTASDTEAADLDTREDAPVSLFGAYDKGSNSYYQRSTSGTCKECYLFSGDNISEVDAIATEINQHYNIY